MANINNPTCLTTGEVRMSYLHVFEPYAQQQGAEPKDVYKRQPIYFSFFSKSKIEFFPKGCPRLVLYPFVFSASMISP